MNGIKRASVILAVAACMALGGCATPDATQAQKITFACSIDTAGRPLATVAVAAYYPEALDELQAVRKTIDVICKDPAAPGVTLAALNEATAQAAQLLAAAQARKAAATAASPPASSPR